MSTLRVLHIDDDPAIRHVVVRILRQVGMRVDSVASGQEAELALARRRYDVIVVDYHIGPEDGLVLIEKLRAKDPHRRMLLLSASLDDAVEERAHELGVVRCIAKGGSIGELVESVRVAAGRSGTIRRDEVLDDSATGTG